jgi:hypothetical protein|tara:strand:+ start:1207 stop:1371 length:165 start_codon:yes stop_codon:yes gene_type:complete
MKIYNKTNKDINETDLKIIELSLKNLLTVSDNTKVKKSKQKLNKWKTKSWNILT